MDSLKLTLTLFLHTMDFAYGENMEQVSLTAIRAQDPNKYFRDLQEEIQTRQKWLSSTLRGWTGPPPKHTNQQKHRTVYRGIARLNECKKVANFTLL